MSKPTKLYKTDKQHGDIIVIWYWNNDIWIYNMNGIQMVYWFYVGLYPLGIKRGTTENPLSMEV